MADRLIPVPLSSAPTDQAVSYRDAHAHFPFHKYFTNYLFDHFLNRSFFIIPSKKFLFSEKKFHIFGYFIR